MIHVIVVEKIKRALEKCSFLIYNGIDFEKKVNTNKKANINEKDRKSFI